MEIISADTRAAISGSSMSILEKFTVIDLIKTRSASVATITGNVLKFNNQTAAELHFAPYIQVLINPKDKQFAIRGCKEDAPNAVPFSKPEGEQKRHRSLLSNKHDSFDTIGIETIVLIFC